MNGYKTIIDDAEIIIIIIRCYTHAKQTRWANAIACGKIIANTIDRSTCIGVYRVLYVVYIYGCLETRFYRWVEYG